MKTKGTCQLKNLEFKQQCGKIGGLYLLAYLAPGYLGGLKFHSFKAYILQALKRGERRSSEHLAALSSKKKVIKTSVKNPSISQAPKNDCSNHLPVLDSATLIRFHAYGYNIFSMHGSYSRLYLPSWSVFRLGRWWTKPTALDTCMLPATVSFARTTRATSQVLNSNNQSAE